VGAGEGSGVSGVHFQCGVVRTDECVWDLRASLIFYLELERGAPLCIHVWSRGEQLFLQLYFMLGG